MDLLHRLLEWLTARPSAPRAGDGPSIDPVDTERIKAEMRLQEEARRLGSANIPPEDAVEITAPESRIVQLVDRSRQAYLVWARNRINVLNQTILETAIEPLVDRVLAAHTVYEHRANALIESRAQVLRGLQRSVHSLEMELRAFKLRNALERDANSPAVTLRILLAIGLVALVLIEGLLNAFFFAQGLDSGILGGWVHAGAFSFVNILAAYAWGRHAIPNLHHVSGTRRLLGAAGIVLGLVVAVAIGLLLAHFRDALTQGTDDAARVALRSFTEHPFLLQELYSIVLFGVSVVFAFLAALDAYRFDDPYPGYGSAARRLSSAIDDCGVELDDLRSSLEALKDVSVRDVDHALSSAETRVHRLHECIESKRATKDRLENALRDAANCADALLRYFRDENRMARSAAVPRYFNEPPALSEIDRLAFDFEADRQRLVEQQQKLARLRDEAAAVKANILAAFNRRHRTITPLDEHFPIEPTEQAYESARA